MRVLVLNPGSSTLKAGLVVEGSRDATDVLIEWPASDDDASTAPGVVREALEALPAQTDAVGYRVVHGGSSYSGPAAVDDALVDAVEALDPLAPLHNRRAAAVIRAGLAILPDVPHVACFDTAFHAGLPEEAWRYPLPADWVERGAVRRYGFHGLSVAWALRRAAELLGREPKDLRSVVAHLGSGCSITAVDGGRSVDTSMGMTPYEGPMMGTRSGSIDPGILFELMRRGVAPDALAAGLAQRSGLLAVAGVAGMRDVEARASAGDERARLAIRMFTRRIAAAVAAAATTLPALDGLVFTGGIGEHSSRVRDDVVRRLEALRLPQELGGVDGDGVAAAGPPAVLIVEAREDLVIAHEVAGVVRDAGSPDRG